MPSPFDVLEIDPDADRAEVERAYRRRVKETHPDLGGSGQAFLEVRAAYEDITNGTAVHQSEPSQEADDAGEQPVQETVQTVEYLNYDRLADFGWDLEDPDLFEKAAAVDLDLVDHGQFEVYPDESILEAAETCGFSWPYACRGGACANCAVGLMEGEISQPVNHILPDELVDRGIRLSCLGKPTTDEVKVIFNIKHLPVLDDLRLPPGPFKRT